MFVAPADPEKFRGEFFKKLLLPIGFLAGLAFFAATFALYWVATTSNDVSLRRQIKLTQFALASSADQVAYEQQGLAAWEQLASRLKQPGTDTAWLDAEIGQWLGDLFRHDMTFILSPDGRPLYAFVDGRSAAPARFATVERDLRPLLESLRKHAQEVGTDQARRGARLRRATALTHPETLFEADATIVGSRPAAASIMLIGPAGKGDPRSQPALVSIRFLDGAFLREMATWCMIDGLRWSPEPTIAPDETMVEFKDERGKRLGYFFWKPELPGARILSVMGPATALFVLLMFAALALLAHSLWRSGRRLSAVVVDLQASEAQAQHIAFHDVLTGLPNRALFHDRLDQALARARRGNPCAILALDLDRFKHVNDTLGHAAGDELIRDFANRLNGLVRASDTVARIGGDEFSILLCDAARREDVEQLCDRILTAVHLPFEVQGNQIFVGVSIGVVLAPEAGTDRGELLRKADIALYRAKAEGRDRYRVFEHSMDETVKLRREIEEDLRRAMAGGTELQVHFQPQVDAGNGEIVGLEALLRWTHPTRGQIAPERFVPIAEETGLISALGDWVVAEACRVAGQWPSLFVSVNLSAVQFRAPDLARRMIAIVEAAHCEPRQIELEITESVLRDEDEIARDTIRALRAAGFRIALDDFGTGYSSLNYLRQLKVDKIKIDRSFTQNLAQDPQAAAVVSSVVTLGHAMGLTVTAEGIESRDQMQLLSAAGCNELQGFLFARALPESAIADLMAGRVTLKDVA